MTLGAGVSFGTGARGAGGNSSTSEWGVDEQELKNNKVVLQTKMKQMYSLGTFVLIRGFKIESCTVTSYLFGIQLNRNLKYSNIF